MGGDLGQRCLWIGLTGNAVLMVGKFAAGYWGQSQALTADGLHSLLDVVAVSAALVGYRIAAKPPDRDHQYGHQNAESLAALVVGLVILATGGMIVRDAIVSLMEGPQRVPAVWTGAVAGGVILSKFVMYTYTGAVARRGRSPVVSATATDHLADVIATGGVLIGVVGARFVSPVLDPLAAFWVAGVILYHAVRVIRQNASLLLGGAPPEKTMRAIIDTLKTVPGVRGLHRLKIRTAGSQLLVDTEVLVDGTLSVEEGHLIADHASERIFAEHRDVVDVVIHVEPHTEERAAEGADPLVPRTRGPREWRRGEGS